MFRSLLSQWSKFRIRRENSPAPRLALAQALRQKGDLEAAHKLCLEIIHDNPYDVATLALLIVMAADACQIEVGLRWARQALGTDPHSVAANYALGQLWEAAEQHPEAEACYRRVTELDAGHAKAFNNLGCMQHIQGRLDEALQNYIKALQLEPDQPEALRNSALITGGTNELMVAMTGYQRRIAANPNESTAHYQLAHIHAHLGLSDQALAGYEQAIATDPNQAEFHFARAQLLLKLGRYREGWREYEWRWRISRFNTPMRRFSQPCWDGSDLPRETLLIHGETGFGDMFQFVRFATLAASRCANVIVECQPELMDLIANVAGVSHVVPQGSDLPAFDVHIPLITLTAVFVTDIHSIPWNGPYLVANPQKIQNWESRVRRVNSSNRKVGLVWTGNPKNMGQQERSVPLSMLLSMTQTDGVSFFSLQKGASPFQISERPQGACFADLTADIADFSDTAALLLQLDLVISVDTSVAHLAGSMGRSVWVLLPFSADWRYHENRDDNPWYPSMRLFRQTSAGNWESALQPLARALKEWVSSHSI